MFFLIRKYCTERFLLLRIFSEIADWLAPNCPHDVCGWITSVTILLLLHVSLLSRGCHCLVSSDAEHSHHSDECTELWSKEGLHWSFMSVSSCTLSLFASMPLNRVNKIVFCLHFLLYYSNIIWSKWPFFPFCSHPFVLVQFVCSQLFFSSLTYNVQLQQRYCAIKFIYFLFSFLKNFNFPKDSHSNTALSIY